MTKHIFLLRKSCSWNAKRPLTTVDEEPSNLIVEARMAYCVRINPAGVGFTKNLRHAIKHARPRLDVYTRITQKEDIGIGGVEEPLNRGGRIVLRIHDVHFTSAASYRLREQSLL